MSSTEFKMFTNRLDALNEKLDEALGLFEDSRLHAAVAAYNQMLELQGQQLAHAKVSEQQSFMKRLTDSKGKIDLMLQRVKETDETLASWSVESGGEWILGNRHDTRRIHNDFPHLIATF